MKINGDLLFHTPTGATTDGQLKNAVIERFAGGAGGANLPTATGNQGNVAGRIVYNSDDNTYYYHNGTAWTPFATGGDAAGLQQEVDNIETTIGGMIDTDGNAVTAVMNGLANVSGASTITDVLQQLDAAIEGKDTLAELDDVTITLAESGDFLRHNGSAWVDHVLVTADLSDTTVTAAELNFLSGVTSDVQTQFNTITANVTANDGDIADILTILGAADGDTSLTYSSTDHVAQNDDVETAIGKLDAALTAQLGAQKLGDLSDVTDGLTSSLTVGDKYFFNATAADAYEVAAATLGALNNIAAGADTPGNDDVLAFDGTQWTAITVNTMLGDGNIGDLGDVTITTVASGDVLYYNGSAWVNGAAGATSGVQPYDAGLAALAAAGTGIVSMDGDTVAFRELTTADAARITLSNGNGVSGNPTFDLATVSDAGTGSFVKITRDAYGRVSGTTPVVTADVEALVDGSYVDIDGDTMTGNLTMTADTEIILNTPTGGWSGDNSVINKKYVDDNLAGLTWKNAVRAASDANTALSGGLTAIDGITLADGDRVLLKGQTDAAENGIYVFATGGNYTRATDMDALTPIDEINGAAVYVQEGTSNGDAGFTVVSQVATLGTDAIDWTQFNGASAVVAGAGLGKTGNELFVNFGAGIVQLPSDEVGVDVAAGLALQLEGSLTGDKLTFVLDGTTLTQSASGLKVDAAGITETELNTSVAGDGLVGGAGVALSVNVDDSTLEVAADIVQVKDAGITNAKLANSSITTGGDTGNSTVALGGTLDIVGGIGIDTVDSTSGQITISGELASDTNAGVASFNATEFTASGTGENLVSLASGGIGNAKLTNSTITMAGDSGSNAVDLGDTFTITGGTLTTTSVVGDTVTIDVAASTADLGDVTAAAAAEGDVMVANGSQNYAPRQICHVYTGGTAATSHTVTHNLGTQYVNVTVYDDTGDVIIPESISTTNANALDVTFNTSIACTVVVMGVAGASTSSN